MAAIVTTTIPATDLTGAMIQATMGSDTYAIPLRHDIDVREQHLNLARDMAAKNSARGFWCGDCTPIGYAWVAAASDRSDAPQYWDFKVTPTTIKSFNNGNKHGVIRPKNNG